MTGYTATAGRWACGREGCGRQLGHDATGRLIHVMDDGGYVYVPHSPRLRQEDVHEAHHDLIDMRRKAMKGIPNVRGGQTRYRRREAWKRYVGTLRGHLQGDHHGRRYLPPLANEDELEALHAELHQK